VSGLFRHDGDLRLGDWFCGAGGSKLREPADARVGAMTWAERRSAGEPPRRGEQSAHDATRDGMAAHPLGKIPGSVWTIPTQPFTPPAGLGVGHYAAFPMEWPRRIITGWSPPGICTACGQGRRPVTTPTGERGRRPGGGHTYTAIAASATGKDTNLGRASTTFRAVTGQACGCPDPIAPTTPAIVLDPFGGTGTTALVAHSLGRHGITLDLSGDYGRLAAWRTSDPGELARALQVDKPATVPVGQGCLLELLDQVGDEEQWADPTLKTGSRTLDGRTRDQSPPTLAASTPAVPPGHPPLAGPRSGGGA
jgi:hypothetical protein